MYNIIGGGIGGLTTGLAFEKLGIEYQIYEAAPELNEIGAGIWLSPNALQIFDWLGILEDLQVNGNSIERMTLAQPDLLPISDYFQDHVKKEYGFSTIAIHRASLQKLLFDKLPVDKIHLNKKFEQFEVEQNQKVKVIFSDGSESVGDYLIGADGINSKVRKQLFPLSKKRDSGQVCWRGIAYYDMKDEFKHRGVEIWGKQIRFGLSGVSKNKVYWFAVGLSKDHRQSNHSSTKEYLLKKYKDYHPIVQELISATEKDKILTNDICDLQPLDNWYEANICLIGDAGHATTPNMGQGGAQAIEDAYYLSNLIHKNPGQNVFNEFQKARFKKVNSVVNQSWSTGKMAHWKFGTGMRDLLLKSLPQKLVQKKLSEMYNIDKF